MCVCERQDTGFSWDLAGVDRTSGRIRWRSGSGSLVTGRVARSPASPVSGLGEGGLSEPLDELARLTAGIATAKRWQLIRRESAGAENIPGGPQRLAWQRISTAKPLDTAGSLSIRHSFVYPFQFKLLLGSGEEVGRAGGHCVERNECDRSWLLADRSIVHGRDLRRVPFLFVIESRET